MQKFETYLGALAQFLAAIHRYKSKTGALPFSEGVGAKLGVTRPMPHLVYIRDGPLSYFLNANLTAARNTQHSVEVEPNVAF